MFAQIAELKTELDTDSQTLGYASLGWAPPGPDNAQAKAIADALNNANRTRERETLSASEIFEAIELAEYQALADATRRQVDIVLTLGDSIQIGPGTKARDFLLGAFGGGTTTRANLINTARETISRATELGWGPVKPGHVQEAWRFTP